MAWDRLHNPAWAEHVLRVAQSLVEAEDRFLRLKMMVNSEEKRALDDIGEAILAVRMRVLHLAESLPETKSE